MNASQLISGNRKIILYSLILTVFLIISVIFKSRAFFVGYSVSILSIWIAFGEIKYKSRLIIFSLSFVLLLLIIFGFKLDSSLGRILVYKISLDIAFNNYLNGIGLGNFGLVYGKYQIEYFQGGNYTISELLLADNTVNAFNDYLELFIESGLVGLAIIASLFIFLVNLIIISFRKNRDRPIGLLLAYSQIVAICTAAIFTHVFKHLFWQILVIFSVGGLIYYCHYIKTKYLIMMTVVISIVIIGFKFRKDVYYYKAYKEMKNARELCKAGMLNESNLVFEKIYPSLKEDVYYLREYSIVLMHTRQFEKAEPILEKLLLKANTSLDYNLLATCYYKNNKLKDAEVNYLKAIYRVPNRFSSRYNLYEFYFLTGQLSKAQKIKEEILRLPVKIASPIIDQIKKKLQQ